MSQRIDRRSEKPAPKISVICAAYNGEAFLTETINSILVQRESQFEVVIVDDASTDGTPRILSDIIDPRFRIFRNESNRRLVYTRNRAIGFSTAPYIAITDQDDVSDSRRLSVQAKILDRNPRVSGVYSLVRAIDEKGRKAEGLPDWCYSGESAKAALLFHNFVSHSSLMFRRSCAPEPVYSSEYPLCEDYNLLVRLADQGDGLCLIKDRLVDYRYHSSNYTKTAAGEMQSLSRSLRASLLTRLGLKPSDNELLLHDAFESSVKDSTLQFFRELREWALHLREANRRVSYVNQTDFDAVLSAEWLNLSGRFTHLGKDAWREYFRGPVSLSFCTKNSPAVARLWVKTHFLSKYTSITSAD
jgi:glycosyltransferase involved in cell wall biosynthesis